MGLVKILRDVFTPEGALGGRFKEDLRKLCDRLIINDEDLSNCLKNGAHVINLKAFWRGFK